MFLANWGKISVTNVKIIQQNEFMLQPGIIKVIQVHIYLFVTN